MSNDHPERPARRPSVRTLCFAALLLAACSAPRSGVAPQEITADTPCALDGMVLADYPGPKAQIRYDEGEPEFFCDTVDMMSMLLRPEQKRHVAAAFTQDMGKAEWDRPQGHWIDARSPYYVVGSRREGSMGRTFASFSTEADAAQFAQKYGGTVTRFAGITLAIVNARGTTPAS